MKIFLFTVFLGVCAVTSAQLDKPGILGGGGPLGRGGLGGGGLGGGLGGGGALGGPGGSNSLMSSSMMKNPMGALMMSSMLGVDVHKIATPMAMMNMGRGGGSRMNMMRWMPLMNGDPSALGMMLSMGMGGGMGMGGMGGMMNPLMFTLLGNA